MRSGGMAQRSRGNVRPCRGDGNAQRCGGKAGRGDGVALYRQSGVEPREGNAEWGTAGAPAQYSLAKYWQSTATRGRSEAQPSKPRRNAAGGPAPATPQTSLT